MLLLLLLLLASRFQSDNFLQFFVSEDFVLFLPGIIVVVVVTNESKKCISMSEVSYHYLRN